MGMLAGGLIGALAGPSGLLLGASGAGLLGSLSDLNNDGVGLDFAAMVGEKMAAETAAVMAEVEEYWTVPLDTRMEQLGGEVHRRTRFDFEDEQFAQEVQAWNDELDELDAEMEQASGEMKAKLKASRDAVHEKLQSARDKARTKADQLEQEHQAKVARLQNQLAAAKDEAQAKMQQRIESIKAGHKARMEKLSQTSARMQEKLAG